MAVRVHFKLEYTVRRLIIPAGTVYEFEYGGPHTIFVKLRAPSSEEQSHGHIASHALCTGTASLTPKESVLSVLQRIERNDVLPAGATEDEIALQYPGPAMITIRLPGLSRFPDFFQSFLAGVRRELADCANRTVGVLRWRACQLGAHNPIGSRGLSWSFDGQLWHPAPADLRVRFLGVDVPLCDSPSLRSDVLAIVRGGGTEPIHHDLFREAWEQRNDNPRSALVIGIAAAELSVKACIAVLVPAAAWLAMHVPTPPLIQMMTDYIPKLPARCLINGLVKPPPGTVLDVLKKGVTMRNQLSHAGAASPTPEDVDEILEAIRDLLWLTDYYSGSEWAWANLREETRAHLLAA